MKYKTLKLRRLRLQKLAAHRRRQRCFTIILFAALFLLAWCAGPNL